MPKSSKAGIFEFLTWAIFRAIFEFFNFVSAGITPMRGNSVNLIGLDNSNALWDTGTLDAFYKYFGRILQILWPHFTNTLAAFYKYFGRILEILWRHFRNTLASF